MRTASPVRVALTRLLKKRPTRLLIEPSGLGHVAELSEHLQKEPSVKRVGATRGRVRRAVRPPFALWAEAPLYRDMVHASDLLILNRRDVDAGATQDVDNGPESCIPQKPYLADRGACSTDWVDAPRDAITIEQEHAPGAEEDATSTGRSARSRTSTARSGPKATAAARPTWV